MVVFYSTHCPKCKVVEMKLQQKNVAYTECNDTEVMKSKGLHSAPALEVDGKILEFADAVKYINTL